MSDEGFKISREICHSPVWQFGGMTNHKNDANSYKYSRPIFFLYFI